MTTHWNHRVVKRTQNGITSYQIHEVYYTENKPIGVTKDGVAAYGETVEELRIELERMLKACDNPVLDYDMLP